MTDKKDHTVLVQAGLLAAYTSLTLFGKLVSRACYGAASALLEPVLPDVPNPRVAGQPGPARQVGNMPVGTKTQAVSPDDSTWNVVADYAPKASTVIALGEPLKRDPSHVRLETETSQEVLEVAGVEGTKLVLALPTVNAYPPGSRVRLHYQS
jgi:hypothetical protein